jgi:amino acid transporter
MAHQEAWWSFVNNLFDLSIYPVMCENYIASLVELQPYQAYLVRFSVLTICSFLNLFGVDVVSKISGFFLVLVLTPFALIIGFGAKHIRPADWWQVRISISKCALTKKFHLCILDFCCDF